METRCTCGSNLQGAHGFMSQAPWARAKAILSSCCVAKPYISRCECVRCCLVSSLKKSLRSKHRSFPPKNSFLDVTLSRTPSPQLILCWHAPVNFETWESQSVSQVRPRYLSSISQLEEANQQRESEKGDSFNVATLGRRTRGSSNSSPSAGS